MVNKRRVAVLAATSLLMQVLAIVSMAPALAASQSGAPSGAIFTTDENGSRVNQNIYEDKRDVYLDGGPGPNAPQTAAGLDDGNYYFQVTGTDGKTLFSTDPVKCREFRVQDGIIVEYVSKNRTYPVPGGARFCSIDGKQNGRHDTGVDQDHNAVTIQLMPFNNSSNPGGVYKAWITPTSEFQGNPDLVDNPSGAGVEHGFAHSASKTDNFKVKATAQSNFETPTITVKKFDDWNGNGVWDSGESEIGVDAKLDGGGWPVAVVDPAGLVSSGYTRFTYFVGFGGNFSVKEGDNQGWVQTALVVDGTARAVANTTSVHVNYTSGETHTVVFGNFHQFKVSGSKVNDANGNGRVDSGEAKLANWGIQIYRNGALAASTTTDANGNYQFTVTQGGSYTVKEVQQTGWTQTGAANYTFTGRSGVNHDSLVFTNHQNGTNEQGGGHCGLILLCVSLNVAVSVSVDLSVTVGADVGTNACTFTLVTADVQVDVEAQAQLGSNGCGCDSNTTVSIDISADAELSTGGSCSSDCGSDTSGGGTGGTCETSCGNTCETGCDTGGSADVSADVNVSVDVGASGGSSGCTSSCESTCDTGCDSSSGGSADVGVDVGVDVGADVGAGSGDCGCGSTGVDVGADVSADVGASLSL